MNKILFKLFNLEIEVKDIIRSNVGRTWASQQKVKFMDESSWGMVSDVYVEVEGNVTKIAELLEKTENSCVVQFTETEALYKEHQEYVNVKKEKKTFNF